MGSMPAPKIDSPDTVALPEGFRAYTGRAGLREIGDDVSIVVADRPSTSAAVFTRSLFAGPSVAVSRENAASGQVRGIVTVAKNANVATGAQGHDDARDVLEFAARAAGVEPTDMLITSTGVIGRRYPMDLLRGHFEQIADSDFSADARAVATAMITTDTHAKTAERSVPTADGGRARIVGIAKGVGMVEPDMATMIAVVLTDAEIPAETLDAAFRDAVGTTFNCLSIDTDTSTSDSAIVVASGAAGPVASGFAEALREVCLDLTLQLARDGEGATKLLTVTVDGARDDHQAKRVAKVILNSPLVKTAVHGADPNWGRVAMAIGKCHDDTDIDQEQVRIVFGDMETYPRQVDEAGLEELTAIMARERVDISVELGVHPAGAPEAGRATVYGCDLTREYIGINADYTT